VSTYSSDPELRATSDGRDLDVASSPMDRLIRVLAFDLPQAGADTELYLTAADGEALAEAILRQVARLRWWEER
jgi:hypothetical protein